MIILGGGLIKHHIANANLMVTMEIRVGCRGSLPVLGLLRFSLKFLNVAAHSKNVLGSNPAVTFRVKAYSPARGC